MVRCDVMHMVWCGMVWNGMVGHSMKWYVMQWYGMVWYGMVWYGTACMVRHSMIHVYITVFWRVCMF